MQLALQGAGNVAPNPMVGAILVCENKIIGEGFHQHYGQAHAELNCINSVADNNAPLIEKSTLYVSLEPCAHFGKTPPCADLIIKHKIAEVVIGCRDSYKEVDGKGIKRLKDAGINVTVGVLEKEALAFLTPPVVRSSRHKVDYYIHASSGSDGSMPTVLLKLSVRAGYTIQAPDDSI